MKGLRDTEYCHQGGSELLHTWQKPGEEVYPLGVDISNGKRVNPTPPNAGAEGSFGDVGATKARNFDDRGGMGGI